MPETGLEREKEIYAARRALEVYGKIDASLQIGNIPRAQTADLLSMCDAAELLSPDERLQHAWLQLEHLLATHADAHAGNADTKDINIARQHARSGFSRLARDTALPARVRAQSMVAAASVPLHENAYLRGGYGGKHLVNNNYAHMEALQDAAKLMLDGFDEDDTQYMNELSAAILFAECAVDNAWFLPAAPRQPWALTAVSHNPVRPGLHIAISEEKRTDILTISPHLLGHGEWKDAANPAFDILEAYAQFRPGFYTKAVRAQRKHWPQMNQIRDFMDVIAARVYEKLNSFTGDTAPDFGLVGRIKKPAEAAATTQETSVDDSLSPDLEWYSNQNATATVADMGVDAFTERLERLQADETLPYRERHGLAWMQRDYAQHLFETETTPDMERINALLDAAVANCIQAVEGYKEAKLPGNTCDAIFDTEAFVVYKALLNGDPKEVKSAVDTYCRRIANLYMFIRDNHKETKGNREQILTLTVCMERITFALLLTAATDEEIDHHLALPGRPRAAEPGAHIDMLVHTANLALDSGYSPTNPVAVKFTNGHEMSFSPGRATIGRELVTPTKDRIARLKKLSAISRDKKGKEKRTPELDNVCAELAMLIVDADEATTEND